MWSHLKKCEPHSYMCSFFSSNRVGTTLRIVRPHSLICELLTTRLKHALEIPGAWNAFIDERQILDVVLIATELTGSRELNESAGNRLGKRVMCHTNGVHWSKDGFQEKWRSWISTAYLLSDSQSPLIVYSFSLKTLGVLVMMKYHLCLCLCDGKHNPR